MSKQSISDFPNDRYNRQRVFVPVDFNVPIQDGGIREDDRLRRTISTIECLSQRGAKLIVASHLHPLNCDVPTCQDMAGAECTLSYDHRVVFGADAARFFTTLEEHRAEPPNWLH
jgi:3-phosphoglycerate kinase